MPEPFKNLFNLSLIERMAAVLSQASPSFDTEAFCKHAGKNLDNLEMMARSEQISAALEVGFSGTYLDNLRVLVKALHPIKTSELADMQTDGEGVAGWAIVPLGSYVARHGMGHPEESLDALRDMTMRFSAEFAVRHFLTEHPEIAMAKARSWSKDENHHVRRLSSEGTRPLLPWGIKLHRFVDDPSPLLPILEALKDDPSDYVRKSVANNLNDISKDHPDLVAGIAVTWLKDAPASRRKLVKHACRTLIKAGHPEALAAFGYGPPRLMDINLKTPEQVTLGDMMPIDLRFVAVDAQALLIDYALHFMRANGKLSPKVFKWTEIKVAAGQVVKLSKNHPYKRVTTRKDYSGEQMVSVHVNGVEIARREFTFQI